MDEDLIERMKTGQPLRLTGVPERQDAKNESSDSKGIPSNPTWLKHDRQVLRFYGFFQEAVVEDPNENFRVRQCIILYYLEDDTFHILEPKVENSGIPQGAFLKRHKLPSPEGRPYHWSDVSVGAELAVYGRVFRITRCDDFTRRFYQDEGVAMPDTEAAPEDPFRHTREMVDMKQIPPDEAETKEYFEVSLNGGMPNKGLQQYLNNDRKVLSFKILWDDSSYHGGDKFYTLNYYLADSQMEIKEKMEQNSGQDSFPLMLRKSKVPKKAVMTHYPGMSLVKEEYYSDADLICGQKIDIFGREVLIFDCDDFTREWYRQRKGLDQVAVSIAAGSNKLMYQPTPMYNGFGSEEDSMGSVKALTPKTPHMDEQKMYKADMHVLRFSCQLVSTEPDDDAREFMVQFYCGDDTIQVYEKCDKNSGRMGGKFLQRKSYKNPATDGNYSEKDFLVGKTVYLQGWRF